MLDSDIYSGLKRRVPVLLRRLRLRLATSIRLSADYSRANMMMFGIVSLIGHPLYYYFWSDVYPQQYENLWLRVISMVVSLPMVFEPQLARSAFWRDKLTAYWLFILLYMLPFFFMFMAFMNDFSPIWSLSTMAACMLLVILVFDWLMTLILAFVGGGLAWGVFMLVDGELGPSGLPLSVLLPTYLFGLIAGSTFNYKTELVAREKLAAITDAVGTMAHELRTPLLGIRSGARGLQNYLPALFEGFELARDHGLPVQPVRKAHYRQMNSVLERINAETEYTSVILDMLLVNSSRTTIDKSTFQRESMNTCIEAALERYPFHTERDRACVEWLPGDDFVFRGSSLLMIHVLFNLMKNSLYYLARVDDGRIRIWAEHQRSGARRLHFRDTGPGIHPDDLPRIFERFYSGLPRGQGTGIGLAFADLVMRSFGGEIRCHSVFGQYTEFVMSFPPIDDDDSN